MTKEKAEETTKPKLHIVEIKLPSELYEKLKAEAEKEYRPISKQAHWIIKEALSK